MKNRKIWFVMAVIIAVGILVTVCNSVLLKEQTKRENAVSKEMYTEDGSFSSEEETFLTDEDVMAETSAMTSAAEATEDTEAETAAMAEVLSPLETTAEAMPEAAPALGAAPQTAAKNSTALLVEEESKNSYRARLDELDLQIQKIRGEGTESTTYSLKTAAENELKLWDSELNNIYNDILSHMDENQKTELVTEEREWMKERDAKAVEAAKKSAGGTMEGLEYTASLASSTRQRAYELASLYDQVTE